MASKILLKKSTTASAVPTTSDVDVGEVAVNTEDKRLFTQDSGANIVELGTTPSSLAVTGNATVGGTLGVTGTTTLGTATVGTKLTVPTPTDATDAASKGYVDTAVTNVIDAAPAALDTLNELAAALGDDANFATTVTNSLATKAPLASPALTGTPTAPTAAADTNTTQIATTAYVQTEVADYLPLAGGTLTGDLSLNSNHITNLSDPSAIGDAANKNYVDTQDALKLSLTGGTMSGAIDMGANKITTTYTPTDNADLTTKTYVDGILGSATSASAALADFDSVYQRSLSTAPALDRNGDALTAGDLYFDTTAGAMYVYDGSSWGLVAPVSTSVTESQISDLGTTIVLDSDIGSTVQAYDADTAKLDVAQAFTAQQTFAELKETVYTLGTSGSIALDPANGSIQVSTLTGDPTFTDSLEAGQTLVLMLNGGASYTVTFPTVTWVGPDGNTAPTLTANDTLVFWKVSTTLYAANVGSYA